MYPFGPCKQEAWRLRSKVLLGAPATEAQDLLPVANDAVLSYIANPALFVCDIFASPAVQAMKDHPQYGSAHKLLDIILRGDMKALQAGSFDKVLEAAKTSSDIVAEKVLPTCGLRCHCAFPVYVLHFFCYICRDAWYICILLRCALPHLHMYVRLFALHAVKPTVWC